MQYYICLYAPIKNNAHLNTNTTCSQFIQQAICEMSHRTLSETNSLDTIELVIERQIQMTFFHSCLYILGRLDTICTDVGQTLDVDGAVDCYV